MRADRLVAILLLLQRRERVTAGEVADELEVSERTARRDLEALAMAGVPVYSERGRHGGWRLLGGGRTDLSGLYASEARALFLVAGTATSLTPEVKSALRKLVRALPAPLRTEAESASRSLVVDPSGWGRTPFPEPDLPHLAELQAATAAEMQVRLGYRDARGRSSERTVDPLGLAKKARTWYLMAATGDGLRTFRVNRITAVERTGQRVVRPPDFDLAQAWQQTVERVESLRHTVELDCLAAEHVVQPLRWLFDRQLTVEGPADDGRVRVRLSGARLEILASQVAGFGRDVEVLGPPEVRRHLAALAGQLRDLYGDPDAGLPGPTGGPAAGGRLGP